MRQHLDMRIETAAIYCLFTVLSQKWNDLWNGVLLIAYDLFFIIQFSSSFNGIIVQTHTIDTVNSY